MPPSGKTAPARQLGNGTNDGWVPLPTRKPDRLPFGHDQDVLAFDDVGRIDLLRIWWSTSLRAAFSIGGSFPRLSCTDSMSGLATHRLFGKALDRPDVVSYHPFCCD
jgi:hypothetical protein